MEERRGQRKSLGGDGRPETGGTYLKKKKTETNSLIDSTLKLLIL